jgi:hypothetical protein
MSCVTSITPPIYIIFASYLMPNQRGRCSTGDAGARRDESRPRTPSCLPSPKMATRAREQKISETGEPKRKVCPYLLGQSSEGGVNVLYSQYEGYSSRGLQEADQAQIGAAIVFPISLGQRSWTKRGTSQCGNRKRVVAASCPSMRKSRTITRSVEAARTAPIVPEVLYGCPATTSLLCRSFHHYRLRLFRIRAWRRGPS